MLQYLSQCILQDFSEVGWGFLQPRNSFWLWLSLGRRQSRLSGKALAAQISRLQKLRKTGTLPPVYPNGWFAVAETRELRSGQVRQEQCN